MFRSFTAIILIVAVLANLLGQPAVASARSSGDPNNTVNNFAPTPSPNASPSMAPLDSDLTTLWGVRLDEKKDRVLKRLGRPELLQKTTGGIFGAYSEDGGNAWLVVLFMSERVGSIQIMKRERLRSTVHDRIGVRIGESDQDLLTQRRDIAATAEQPWLFSTHRDGVEEFYGIDRLHEVERFGITRKVVEEPAYIRWFQFNGMESNRPFAVAAVGEQAIVTEESTFVQKHACGSGLIFWPVERSSKNGVDRIIGQCGNTGVRRPFYFKPSNRFQADVATTITHLGGSSPTKPNLPPPISLPSTVPGRDGHLIPKPLATLAPLPHWMRRSGRRAYATTPAPSTDLVWMLPTDRTGGEALYRRFTSADFNGQMDMRFNAINNAAHPLQNTFLYFPDPTTPAGFYPGRTLMALHSRAQEVRLGIKRRAFKNPMRRIGLSMQRFASSGPPPPSSCGLPKCFGPLPGGPSCPGIGADYGGSNPGEAVSPCVNTPSCSQVNTCPDNPNSCPNMGWGGGPIDFIKGTLRYTHIDAHLSGPLGIVFGRTYNSQDTNYMADLGSGWHHAYSAFLDLTYINSLYSVVRHSNCGALESFVQISPGIASYDPIEESTLLENSDGSFTLTMKNKTVESYDSGGALISITDRFGNAQTIARDLNNGDRMTSVTDSFGKSLVFAYDSQSRITGITSSPSAISILIGYDSGLNCTTGELCSITESDGSVWRYQYSQSPVAHLLATVVDPLGHVSENDSYQMYQSTPIIVHQNTDSGSNSLSITYNFGSLASQTGTCPSGPECTVTTVTDGLGRTTTYSANSGSRSVVSVVGPECMCTTFEQHATYDVYGRIRSESDLPDNFAPKKVYYYADDVLYTTPDGSTTYTLKAIPRTTEVDQPALDPESLWSTTYNYYPEGDPRGDLVNSMTQPTDVVGGPATSRTAMYSYDMNGRLQSESVTGNLNSSSSATYTKSFSYDSRGRLVSVTGPRTDLTQQTTISYFSDSDSDIDRRGLMKSMTDAKGHTTVFANGPTGSASFDIYGHALSVTDPNNVTTVNSFDALGRSTRKSVLPASSGDSIYTSNISYDIAGRLVRFVSPRGNQLQFTYDSNNRPLTLSRADQNANQYEQRSLTYDAIGQPISSTMSACVNPSISSCNWITTKSVKFSRDSTGRVSQILYAAPVGTIAAIYYVTSGPGQGLPSNVVVSTGGDTLRASSTSYDLEGRVLTNSAFNTSNTYAYDLAGHVASVTTSATSSTSIEPDQKSYSFDDFGRMFADDPSAVGLLGDQYNYDADGDLVSRHDPNGNVQTYTFDALDRPLSEVAMLGTPTTSVVSAPGATISPGTESVNWSYDNGSFGIGRLAQVTDPSGSTSYGYEERGFVASENQTVSTSTVGLNKVSTTYQSSYSYDPNGNLVNETYPSGRAIAYSYDYADRPTSVKSAATTYVSVARYQPFGPVNSIAYGNGSVATMTYDQNYRLSENKLASPSGNTLSDLSYSFDGLSRLSQVTDNVTPANSESIGYLNGQLREVSSTGLFGNAFQGTDGYQNLQSSSFSNYQGNSHSIVLGFSGLDPLQPTTVTNDGGAALPILYDANGNERSVGASTYTYSSRDELQSGDGLTYAYDGSGKRVITKSATVSKTSLYAGMHLRSEFQPASNAVQSSYQHDYIYLGGLPIAQEDVQKGSSLPSAASGASGQGTSDATRFTFADNIGAPIIQTNNSGQVVWQGDYEPNGRMYQLRTAYSHQPLRRPGQESEELDGDPSANANGASPRYYNNARWYRPEWFRYTQRDPIGVSGGTNLYTYAGNDPFSMSDPMGTQAVAAGPAVAGGAAALNYLLAAMAAACVAFLTPEIAAAAALLLTAAALAWALNELAQALDSGALAQAAGCEPGGGAGSSGGNNGGNNAGGGNGSGGAGGDDGGGGGNGEPPGGGPPESNPWPPPRPPVPPGVPGLNAFGKIMNWGTGNDSALAQIPALTREGLEADGVTYDMAEQWAQFYKYVAQMTPGNPSAAGRAVLMQAAADLLK